MKPASEYKKQNDEYLPSVGANDEHSSGIDGTSLDTDSALTFDLLRFVFIQRASNVLDQNKHDQWIQPFNSDPTLQLVPDWSETKFSPFQH